MHDKLTLNNCYCAVNRFRFLPKNYEIFLWALKIVQIYKKKYVEFLFTFLLFLFFSKLIPFSLLVLENFFSQQKIRKNIFFM